MIIAIDFDGTTCTELWPQIGEPVPGAMEAIRRLHREGHHLILWTCRTGQTLDEALDWLQSHGVRHLFAAVNAHLPEQMLRYGTDPRKLGADLYIDDRAVGWTGWADVSVWVRHGLRKARR